MDASSTNGETRSAWPADYYSSETPAAFLPRWAIFGCGGAGLLVMLLVFAGGAFLSSDGMADFMDMAVGMSVGEMKGMYASAVTPEQRTALESEIETMREAVRNRKLPVSGMQPFLQELRKAGADNTVTVEEAVRLTDTVRKINVPAKR